MRPAPILPSLALAACLASPSALAQQPGWVDPPAKPAETATPEAGPPPEEARKRAEPAPPRGETGRSPGRSPMPARHAPAVRETVNRETVAKETVAKDTLTRDTAAKEIAAKETAGKTRTVTGPSVPARAETVGLERSARALAREYLATVSGDGMIEATPRLYSGWVRFHDRLISQRALMAEKRRFAQRWPERRYEPQGALRAACSEAARTCVVRGQVSFEAASAQRGQRSAGLVEIALTITLTGERPVIVAETSRVVRRGLASSAGARFIPEG